MKKEMEIINNNQGWTPYLDGEALPKGKEDLLL